MRLGLSLGLSRAGGGGGAAVPDFFVDSVGGSDANDGTASDAAFATLGALETAALANGAGTVVSLAKGSTWREELAFGATTGITVTTHGTGDPPKLIATEVATGWTQPDAGTYPNVWYIPSWISDCVNDNYPLAIFENGIELPNVASLALVNATAGRTFIATTPDGNDALYLHATGSGNPNSNGSTYEASKRVSCIYGATSGNTSLSILGPLELRDAPWASGAAVAAENATMKQIFVANGTKHSTFLTSGSVEDCVYRGSTPRLNAGQSNFLVFFTTTAGTWAGSVKRAFFLAGDAPFGSSGAPATYESVAGFFSHNDQAGAVHEVTAEQCAFVNIESLGGFRGSNNAYVGLYAKDSGSLNLTADTAGLSPVTHSLFNGGVSTSQLSSWDVKVAFAHCVDYDHKQIRQGDGWDVQNSIWYRTGSGNALTQPLSNAVQNLAVNNSVVITNGWAYCIDMGTRTSYTGDHNVFASIFSGREARFRYNNIDNASAVTDQYKLRWWQTATGQDANSVWLTSAQLATFFLGTIANGDFRINPSASVTAGDGTVYVGQFPDGTPITEAGPQFHWDWNARAAVAGPPTSWPTVPESEADARTYIGAPQDWDFYP